MSREIEARAKVAAAMRDVASGMSAEDAAAKNGCPLPKLKSYLRHGRYQDEFNMDLSVRAANCLTNMEPYGPKTAEFAASLTAKQVLAMNNSGNVALKSIRDALARRGLKLSGD